MSFEVVVETDPLDKEEFRQRLRILHDGYLIREEFDGGEPEDQSFYRDWSWVAGALRQAYECGFEDGKKEKP